MFKTVSYAIDSKRNQNITIPKRARVLGITYFDFKPRIIALINDEEKEEEQLYLMTLASNEDATGAEKLAYLGSYQNASTKIVNHVFY